MTYLRDTAKAQREDIATPQSEPLPGTTQQANSAGGYTWVVDDWKRLDRFLILGAEGGTYYISQKALGAENAGAVTRCVRDDGLRTVRRIVEVSQAGRAPKNDPALLALAIAATKGSDEVRHAALEALPKVARTGTHLLHFAAYAEGMRGWGRGLRSALARWYTEKTAASVAFQAVKYQSRDKWTQRDLLRLAHPKPPTDAHKAVFYWMVKGWPGVGDEPHPDEALRLIWAFERAKRATDAADLVRLIRDYRLPRECVPTSFLKDTTVWQALLEADMPMTALIRNLATMTKVGLLAPLSDVSRVVCEQLADRERLRKARVHPIALLSALKVYQQGHGGRSDAKWNPVAQVVDALDAAFYTAFDFVEPTNKRWLLALDVSGSMGMGAIAGVPGLTPRIASAAMAMVTARVEPQHAFVAFTARGGTAQTWGTHHRDDGVSSLAISPRQRLDDVIKTVSGIPFGGTDCALPMVWALEHKTPVDVFVVLTDNETWAGDTHPSQALKKYRQEMAIDARLIVVGMTATSFSIADPEDAGMLDVVGFDTATPSLMAAFSIGDA